MNIWENFDFKTSHSKIVRDTLDEIANDLKRITKNKLDVEFIFDYINDDNNCDEKYKGYDYMYSFRIESSYSKYGYNLFTILESKSKNQLLLYSTLIGVDDAMCEKTKKDIIKMFKDNISNNKIIEQKIISLYNISKDQK